MASARRWLRVRGSSAHTVAADGVQSRIDRVASVVISPAEYSSSHPRRPRSTLPDRRGVHDDAAPHHGRRGPQPGRRIRPVGPALSRPPRDLHRQLSVNRSQYIRISDQIGAIDDFV